VDVDCLGVSEQIPQKHFHTLRAVQRVLHVKTSVVVRLRPNFLASSLCIDGDHPQGLLQVVRSRIRKLIEVLVHSLQLLFDCRSDSLSSAFSIAIEAISANCTKIARSFDREVVMSFVADMNVADLRACTVLQDNGKTTSIVGTAPVAVEANG
jgi:hypothetical protein